MVRARSAPTPEAYRAFLEEFPDSPGLDELRSIVEEALFLSARALGSAEAYREFLLEFSGGAYAARAAGNAEYLEERGFEGRPHELADFAARHPESDFAAEAVRSSAAVRVRDESGFRRVGLTLEIAEGTPDADRLARAFTERAVDAYRAAELELIPLEDAGESGGESLPARLTIRHREQRVATEFRGGEIISPAMLATTELTLAAAGESEPIWSREIEYRDSGSLHRAGKSILFGPVAHRYWSAFFVPRATWNTQVAVREAQIFSRPIVAVETARDRALVLFGDGEFRILDLADAAQPLSLGDYRRERDLTHWSGIRLLEPGAVLFGEDGIEMVEFGPGGPRRVGALDRATVGSVVAVESAEGRLVTAGNRGLQVTDASGQRVVDSADVVARSRIGVAGRHLVMIGERALQVVDATPFLSPEPLASPHP
jgi:hypothetical protein